VIISELQKFKVPIQLLYIGYKVVNTYTFVTITTRYVEISISYLINRVRVVYQNISIVRFKFFYVLIFVIFIH
jgi:hypothetical protein